MKGYGLIGFPLSHSFSSRYFADKFRREGIEDCYYRSFPLEDIRQLPELISEHPDLRGLNVTIPYKEKVMSFLDDIDGDAKSIGAVNTLKISRSQDSVRIKGYNTDAHGFRKSLEPLLTPVHKHALVLGTGGASKAVAFVLRDLGIRTDFVSRHPRQEDHIAYQDLTGDMISACLVIINTSPLGMHPHTDASPDIPYEHVSSRHVMYDLVYNPPETVFLKEGRKRGAVTANGLDMLHYQADKAWEIWNNNEI